MLFAAMAAVRLGRCTNEHGLEIVGVRMMDDGGKQKRCAVMGGEVAIGPLATLVSSSIFFSWSCV